MRKREIHTSRERSPRGEGSSFRKWDDSRKTDIMIILTLKIPMDTLCTGSFNIQKLILPTQGVYVFRVDVRTNYHQFISLCSIS